MWRIQKERRQDISGVMSLVSQTVVQECVGVTAGFWASDTLGLATWAPLWGGGQESGGKCQSKKNTHKRCPAEPKDRRPIHTDWTDGLQRGNSWRGQPGARPQRSSSERASPKQAPGPQATSFSDGGSGLVYWGHDCFLEALSEFEGPIPCPVPFTRKRNAKAWGCGIIGLWNTYQPPDVGYVPHIIQAMCESAK